MTYRYCGYLGELGKAPEAELSCLTPLAYIVSSRPPSEGSYVAPVNSPSNPNGEGSLVPIPTRKVGQVPLSILACSVSHYVLFARQVSVLESPTNLHSLDAHAYAHARSLRREHGHVHGRERGRGHANARDRGSARRARAAGPKTEWTRWSGMRM